jgi:tRNA A-37 threonylcarbamoyl transferase component Bud32
VRALLERIRSALGDRYEVEREVGVGGMATVFRARDLKHDRQVAIKVLRPELAATLGAERFLGEIRIAARLQHPYVLPLYDSGEAQGFLYYVMPFVEGESLRGRLVKEGELPVQAVVRIVRDVAEALAYAHRQGVVHRDVKPDNVMFAEEHSLVTDFGVAKAVSAAAASPNITGGMALGTPTYMAPEQAAADPATDHRADIYALGAMAYEMLAGRPVFTAPTPQGVLAAHVVETPVPVAEHRPSVPPALADLVMRCLEKKPADRWQTADEMLPHLEAMLTPSGPVTPAGGLGPFRVLRRGGRWLARRPAAVGGAAALLVAVVVALRLFGGWPVPSLVASGVLDRREPIVLADFQNRSADSSLGATVTELFRVGFSRSRSVRLMDPSRIADALGRMRRPPGTPLDVALAREVAQREGVRRRSPERSCPSDGASSCPRASSQRPRARCSPRCRPRPAARTASSPRSRRSPATCAAASASRCSGSRVANRWTR